MEANPGLITSGLISKPLTDVSQPLYDAPRSPHRSRGKAFSWQELNAQQLDRRYVQSWLVERPWPKLLQLGADRKLHRQFPVCFTLVPYCAFLVLCISEHMRSCIRKLVSVVSADLSC